MRLSGVGLGCLGAVFDPTDVLCKILLSPRRRSHFLLSESYLFQKSSSCLDAVHLFGPHHFSSLATLFENRALASTPCTFQPHLKPSWGCLGLSWALWGLSWGVLGLILGCLGFILGRGWAQTCSTPPKLPPRLPKTGQYGPQKVPRRPLEGPKMAPHSPKTALDGSKMAQDSPTTGAGQLKTGPGQPKTAQAAQDRPTTGPGQPKTGPRQVLLLRATG